MATLERGFAPLNERRDRPVLTRRDPSIESLLAGLSFADDNLEHVRAWSKKVLRDRNDWSIRTAKMRGIFGARIRREDADAALRKALAELKGAAHG